MILLGLGSNLGDRSQNLKKAVALLQSNAQISIEKMSSFYETEPFGLKEQPAFLNAVLRISTDLSPEALLDYCQWVEQELGRERKVYWGPRSMDVDLLIFDEVTMRTEKLILPHPYLTERNFVLMPIMEISDAQIVDGYTAGELLQRCTDSGKVEIYQPAEAALLG